MALTYEQYSKLCDAEKYFKRLYDDTERYIYVKKEEDGMWHVLRFTYAQSWRMNITHADNDLGGYKTRKLAKEARESARRAEIRMPAGAKFGEPTTFMSVLQDNEDYAQLNRHSS
jgi:hypothetical protein